MNTFSFLRATEYIGAKELRVHLDKVLHSTHPYRVMLHNKPTATILPDGQFLQLLELLEELRGSGLLEKAARSLKRQSRKGNIWFWNEAWQKGERKVDVEIRRGKLKRANSAAALIKTLHQ